MKLERCVSYVVPLLRIYKTERIKLNHHLYFYLFRLDDPKGGLCLSQCSELHSWLFLFFKLVAHNSGA